MNDLKSTLDQHKLLARKSLGQHFLKDAAVVARIIQHYDLTDQLVVEVGPGPGSLTRILVQQPLKFLLTIEKDKRFIPILEEFTKNLKNFACVQTDALKASLPEILQRLGHNTPYHIIANLPYNIGTELLVRWTVDLQHISSITVMLQKEVVDRMKAKVNTKDYGRLSILMQTCFHIQEMFQVPPSAFIPPPKVWSSVVYLKPVQILPDSSILKMLGKITQFAFSARRKMLRASLGKQLPLDLWQEICASLNIDESIRPENLTPKLFYEIAKICSQKLI